MTLQAVLSVAMLGAFIWVVRFLLPKAVKEREPFALICAVLTAVLAQDEAVKRVPGDGAERAARSDE
ncbi:MAG: hypothetical protein A3H96_09300 [Acidobacteria bacterium RIFCSPLOWO2_02_FULL_67_36]|nr:MAG: hypothetical protein A3H96_09300 [Acidobacteria bacterium RIFCSPLOWO2_02_FULL_67_36]OFW25031.1 MAG: hypothetical protein A3G21_16435 [Acidobacteria bacterium RIFCSPLOWO2_12_FULL_66_21]